MKTERIIEFLPAFDKRNKNPKKDYGICAVRIFFVLKGEEGAVSTNFSTKWFLPETIEEYKKIGIHGRKVDLTEGNNLECWSIDIHSKKPLYEGQNKGKCDFTGTGKCFLDGTFMRAKPYSEVLIRKGSDAIWKILEKEYEKQFGRK